MSQPIPSTSSQRRLVHHRGQWQGATMESDLAGEKFPVTMENAESAPPIGPARWHFWSSRMLAPKLARGILLAVLGSFYLIAFLKIPYLDSDVLSVVLSAIYMVILLGLQIFYFNRPPAQLRTPIAYLALLLQAALVYLPMLHFQQAWIGMPGFLAGTVLLVLPPTLAWIAFATVVASMGVAQAIFT